MKNLQQVIEGVFKKVYNVTNKQRIQQKEQLVLKQDLTEALFNDMVEAGFEVVQVPKGVVLIIENEEEGGIPVEINIVTKPLDYDYDIQHEEWLAKQEKVKK